MKFSFNLYKEMTMVALESEFGKENIKEISITKNNGVIKEGVNILEKDKRIAPVIYFDTTKEIYDERDVSGFLEQALYACREVQHLEKQGLEKIFDWEVVKKFLRPRVINYDANCLRLRCVPYVRRMDLAVTFCVEVTTLLSTDDKRVATVDVSNFMVNLWNVDLETIYHQAMENLEGAGYYIKSIRDFLTGYQISEPEEKLNAEILELFVVTCYDGIGGAAAILSSKLLKKFSEEINCPKVYILPSSVHEIILVDAEKAEVPVLKSIVVDVNKNEVSPIEYLSDSVYYFSEGLLEVV